MWRTFVGQARGLRGALSPAPLGLRPTKGDEEALGESVGRRPERPPQAEGLPHMTGL
jgi:hypothetical protein